MEISRQEHEFLQSPRIYRFGDFVLNIGRYELTKAGVSIRLQPKTFDVLAYLVTHPERLVDKDELFRAVWPNVVVTENSLTHCIKDLRKALDDDAAQPRYIETIPRRGYRLLVAPSAVVEAAVSTDSPPPATPPHEPVPLSAGSVITEPPKRHTLVVAGVMAVLAAVGLVAAWLGWQTWRGAPAAAGPAAPTIAVLPFANLSAEPDTQYFADGVAEDLLDLLAKMPNLRVVARTSSFAFRGKESDIKEIARELRVDWVLEGSVRRETGNVRVTVQLIDARTGFHAWSERYERKYTDLFAMQDEIARAVVAQVGPRVEPGMPVAAAAPTANFEAYQSYMIGRDYLNRRSSGWLKKALAAFDRAIELDPAFARAHAGKAIVETLSAASTSSPGLALARARESADRALQLDPQLALGFAARGLVLMNEGSDLRGAEAALRRALQLDPTHGNVYNWLANVLRMQHRREEAFQQNQKGIGVDPLNPVLIENRARRLFFKGQFDDARAGYLKLLQLPAAGDVKYRSLIELHMARGELAEALRYLILMEREAGAENRDIDVRRGIIPYARLGMVDEAERRFKAATVAPMAVNGLPTFASYLGMFGRLQELEPLARPHLAAAGMAPWLERAIGSVAVLRGNYDAGIAKLAPFFRQTPAGGMGGWGGDVALLDEHLALAFALMKMGRQEAAQAEIGRLLEWHRAARVEGLAGTPEEMYLYAMTLALASPARDDEALAALEKALSLGWSNHRLADNDPRWERQKSAPRFKAVMAKAAESAARERAKVEARIASGDPDYAGGKS